MPSRIPPRHPGKAPGRFFRSRLSGAGTTESFTPVISSISPASSKIAGGGTVTIAGSNFNVDTTGTPIVLIGGVAAAGVVVVDHNTITATIPAHVTGLVDVEVIDSRGRLSLVKNAFNYVEPSVLRISPNIGPMDGGTVVHIAGANFSAGAAITFGGVPATAVTYIDDSNYVVTTPAHAKGPAKVVIDGTIVQGGYFYTAELPGSTLRRVPSVHVSHSTNGPATCSYSVDGQTGSPPTAGSEIVIHDQFDNEIFAGVAQIVTQQFEELSTNLRWDVAATDYVVWLNRRRPVGTYVQMPATDVIYDMCGKFASWVNLEFVQTDLAEIDIAFDGSETFADCLNAIASLLGRAHWRMDRKELHFFRVPPPKLSNNSRPVKEIGVGPGTAPTASLSSVATTGFSYAPGYYAFRSSFLFGDLTYGYSVVGANASGSTTLSINVPSNPHPLLRGATITISGGAAAGIYVVRQDTSIHAGINAVPLTYGLKGSTTGGESILIVVSESAPSPLSNLAWMDGVHYPRIDNIAVGVSAGALVIVGRRIYFQFFGLKSAVDLGFYNEIPDNGITTLVSEGFVGTSLRGVPRLPATAPPLGPQTAPSLGEAAQTAKDVLATIIPSVGNLVSYSFQSGSYVVFVTNVYADGTESRSSPQSNLMQFSGKKAVTVGALPGPSVNGIPVIYRLVYGSRSGKVDSYVDVGATSFWGVIPDNTSTLWMFTPGLKKVGSQQPALPETGEPGDHREHTDGPNPEDGSHPAEINDSNAGVRLYTDPQLVSSDDVTEAYNRVIVIGRGIEVAPPVILPPPVETTPASGGVDPYKNSVAIYADGTTPTSYLASHPGLKPWKDGYPMNQRWSLLQKDYAARSLVSTQTPTPSTGGYGASVGGGGGGSGGGIDVNNAWWQMAYGATGGRPNLLGGYIPQPPWMGPSTPTGAPPTTTSTSSDGIDHFKEYLASLGITPQYMLEHPYTVFMDLSEGYYELGGEAGITPTTGTATPIEDLNDNTTQSVTPTITRPMYQVDDLESQKYFGELEKDANGNPSDGVHEIYLDGSNFPSGEACIEYANSYLTLHAWPAIAIRYAVRELGHKPGRLIAFDLTKPPLKGTFAIQSVDTDHVRDESDELMALYSVTASSVKLDDLNDVLALIGGRSTAPALGAGANPLSIARSTAQARAEASDLTASALAKSFSPVLVQRNLTKIEVNAGGTLEFVPAPGPGYLLMPLDIWGERNTTAVFSVASNITLKRGIGTALLASLTSLASSTETGYRYVKVTSISAETPNNAVDYRNTNLLLDIANASTGGSDGIRISMLYVIVPAP